MSFAMIYGATGYTGNLASERAKEVGINTILSGRQSTKLEALATRLRIPWRVFTLDDPISIPANLKDVAVVLNCAGPFAMTTMPLAEACIQSGVHYLDVSAELSTYLALETLHERAITADVMLLPGGGGSVAILGCLASQVAARVQDASSVDIALHVSGPMSRGSITSANSAVVTDCLRRSEGKLVKQEPDEMMFDFDDGRGSVPCFRATLPDLFTVWRTTGIPNVRTYVNVSGNPFSATMDDQLYSGPAKEERESNPYDAAVVVDGSRGEVVRGELHAVNGYTFTAQASIEVIRLILHGKVLPGLQTPVTAFGAGFVDSVEHTFIRVDKRC